MKRLGLLAYLRAHLYHSMIVMVWRSQVSSLTRLWVAAFNRMYQNLPATMTNAPSIRWVGLKMPRRFAQ
jgi:hypothetical protein